MESYQGSGGTYEPSADELIDVLKNLENLAAQNPALYRAIVDQIKGTNLLCPFWIMHPTIKLGVLSKREYCNTFLIRLHLHSRLKMGKKSVCNKIFFF